MWILKVLTTLSLGDTVTQTEDDRAFCHNDADITMILYVFEAVNYDKGDPCSSRWHWCVCLTCLLGVLATAGEHSANGTLGWDVARYQFYLRCHICVIANYTDNSLTTVEADITMISLWASGTCKIIVPHHDKNQLHFHRIFVIACGLW